MKKNIFFLIFLFFKNCLADEFIYPVASVQYHNEEKIFLLYQKSIHHLELWLWNPATYEADKILLSRYTPAGLSVLPNNSGFSFIDNDRIRVKFFQKRSPKVIPIFDLLYNISPIVWLDNESFYFTAQYNEKFSIYWANLTGETYLLIEEETSDCLFPQKVDNYFYYIERDSMNNHYINRIIYPNKKFYKMNLIDELEFSYEKCTQFCIRDSKEQLASLGQMHIGFLNMINENLGFFIEHPKEVHSSDTNITFACHILINKDTEWITYKLFSFVIRAEYLLHKSDNRFYESILPFLPRYNEEGLFFINYDDKPRILFFNLKENKIVQIISLSTQNILECICAVFPNKERFYYGGNLAEKVDSYLPYMWINQDSNLCFSMPSFQKKEF